MCHTLYFALSLCIYKYQGLKEDIIWEKLKFHGGKYGIYPKYRTGEVPGIFCQVDPILVIRDLRESSGRWSHTLWSRTEIHISSNERVLFLLPATDSLRWNLISSISLLLRLRFWAFGHQTRIISSSKFDSVSPPNFSLTTQFGSWNHNEKNRPPLFQALNNLLMKFYETISIMNTT